MIDFTVMSENDVTPIGAMSLTQRLDEYKTKFNSAFIIGGEQYCI